MKIMEVAACVESGADNAAKTRSASSRIFPVPVLADPSRESGGGRSTPAKSGEARESTQTKNPARLPDCQADSRGGEKMFWGRTSRAESRLPRGSGRSSYCLPVSVLRGVTL